MDALIISGGSEAFPRPHFTYAEVERKSLARAPGSPHCRACERACHPREQFRRCLWSSCSIRGPTCHLLSGRNGFLVHVFQGSALNADRAGVQQPERFLPQVQADVITHSTWIQGGLYNPQPETREDDFFFALAKSVR